MTTYMYDYDYPVQTVPVQYQWAQPLAPTYVQYPARNQYYEGPGLGWNYYNDEYIMDDYAMFTNTYFRCNFVNRVYTILAILLFLTTVLLGAFLFEEELKLWAIEYYPFGILALATYLIIAMSLAICPEIRRMSPINFILLLFLFTSVAFILIYISILANTLSIFLCLATTMLICTAVSFFALNTTFDIRKWYSILITWFAIMILFGIVCKITTSFVEIPFWHMVYALVLLLLVMVSFFVHTFLILDGVLYAIWLVDYVAAVITFYVDVFMLFTLFYVMCDKSRY